MQAIGQYATARNGVYFTLGAISITCIVLAALNLSSVCRFIPPQGSYFLLGTGGAIQLGFILSFFQKTKTSALLSFFQKTKTSALLSFFQKTKTSTLLPSPTLKTKKHLNTEFSFLKKGLPISGYENEETFVDALINEACKQKISEFTYKKIILIVLNDKENEYRDEIEKALISSGLCDFPGIQPKLINEKASATKIIFIIPKGLRQNISSNLIDPLHDSTAFMQFCYFIIKNNKYFENMLFIENISNIFEKHPSLIKSL